MKTYESLGEWMDELSGEDPYVGVVYLLNLSQGPTPAELRAAADAEDNSCCGWASGIGMINGEVFYLAVDFGH